MSDKPQASPPISWWLNVINYCGWWLNTVVEVEDSVIHRYGTALLLFLFILTISGLCMGFWEMKKLFGDLKSDLGTKIEDVGRKVDDLKKEIQLDLKLQRDAS